jgi:hypothetical protein
MRHHFKETFRSDRGASPFSIQRACMVFLHGWKRSESEAARSTWSSAEFRIVWNHNSTPSCVPIVLCLIKHSDEALVIKSRLIVPKNVTVSLNCRMFLSIILIIITGSSFIRTRAQQGNWQPQFPRIIIRLSWTRGTELSSTNCGRMRNSIPRRLSKPVFSQLRCRVVS